MPIKQSAWAAGRKVAAVSGCAGEVVAQKFEFTVNENLAIGDIVEIGVLPAEHDVSDMVAVVDAMGAGVTVDVGVMSGDYGDTDQSRTSSNEFFAAQAVATATVARMSAASGFRLDSSRKDRSIGVKIGGAGVTASGQVITLEVMYRQKS